MNTNNTVIRLERKEDYREVENLVREAFWNVYRPGCSEHFVIHVLRDDPAFVKELDFVMEQDGRLIGQNMFMRTVINADDGRVIPVLTMGPIGITPELKRHGYGKKLLDYCLEKATAMPMPGTSASAITICRRARTTPSSSARSSFRDTWMMLQAYIRRPRATTWTMRTWRNSIKRFLPKRS